MKRGNQPYYYYSLMTPLYEYMTLLLTLAGAWWLGRRGNLHLLVLYGSASLTGLTLAGESALASRCTCPAPRRSVASSCWRAPLRRWAC